MEKEYIIFDTNYINKILSDKDKYCSVLKELRNDYLFSINIGTFVEIIKQRIKNQSKFEEILNLFEDFQFAIGEFRNFKCIEDTRFSFQNFKQMSKKQRKKFFDQIYTNYYNFVCNFITIFLEWILYALLLLVKEELKSDFEYKKYLEKQSKKFQKDFLKSYYNKKELKIKEKFNKLVYIELKKLNHIKIKLNKELLNSILENYNQTNLMNVFKANKKSEKDIQKKFVELFYEKEIKPYTDLFNNEIFSKYIKKLFEKIIVRCGKLEGNDITDSLIVSSVNNKDYILLTDDQRIQKFLKEEMLYKEDIYIKFD